MDSKPELDTEKQVINTSKPKTTNNKFKKEINHIITKNSLLQRMNGFLQMKQCNAIKKDIIK